MPTGRKPDGEHAMSNAERQARYRARHTALPHSLQNSATAAALEVLMGPDGMQQLMIRAIAAATRRSRELAK